MGSPIVFSGTSAKLLTASEQFTDQGSDPATPPAGTQIVYSKSAGIFTKNSSGTVAQLASSSLATPTVAGTTTSYFPTILFTTGNSDRTCNLPAAASNTGRTITIRKVDSGTGSVIIDANSTELIDGALTGFLNNQYSSITYLCNGTGWTTVATTGNFYTANISTAANAASTGNYLALLNINIRPGARYLVSWGATGIRNGATITDTTWDVAVGTTSASNSGTVDGITRIFFHGPDTSSTQTSISGCFYINLTSTTQYFLNVAAQFSAGTPQWRGYMHVLQV